MMIYSVNVSPPGGVDELCTDAPFAEAVKEPETIYS